MTQYHFKGEGRMRRNRPSRSDRSWYRSWWQAYVDVLRDRAADNPKLAPIIAADLEFARQYGVR